ELSHYAQQAESTLYALTANIPQADDPAADPTQSESAPATASVAARSFGRGTVGPAAAEAAPFPWFRRLAFGLLTVSACWSGGAISYLLASAHNSGFTYADARLAVPSLLTGVAVSALLLGGARLWPRVFMGTPLSRSGLRGEPLPTALLFSAVYTAAAFGIV